MGEMLKPEERRPLKPLGFPLTMNPGHPWPMCSVGICWAFELPCPDLYQRGAVEHETKYWISWDGNRLDNAGYPIPIYFQSILIQLNPCIARI